MSDIWPYFVFSWFWVVPDGKSSQKFPLSGGVSQGSILGHAFLLLHIRPL